MELPFQILSPISLLYEISHDRHINKIEPCWTLEIDSNFTLILATPNIKEEAKFYQYD